MTNGWVSAQQLQDNINLIKDLLQLNGPDYVDRPFYEQMLEEQYEELRAVQANQSATTAWPLNNHMDFSTACPAQPASPASSSGASRKRSLGHDVIYPDLKRPSMNPSPITPNTPSSVASEPAGYHLTMAGPSHQQTLSKHPIQAEIIDLTQSNPPSPDPFPELNNAFMVGALQPPDIFQHDFMREQELARFLAAPTPVGTGHTFYQPSFTLPPVAGPAYPAYPAYRDYDTPDVPFFIGSNDKPWAPSDCEDECGFPLTIDEAQAVENLLGNVSAHDAEDTPERREQTPRIMCSKLKEYQKIGLTWLIKVHNQSTAYYIDTC